MEPGLSLVRLDAIIFVSQSLDDHSNLLCNHSFQCKNIVQYYSHGECGWRWCRWSLEPWLGMPRFKEGSFESGWRRCAGANGAPQWICLQLAVKIQYVWVLRLTQINLLHILHYTITISLTYRDPYSAGYGTLGSGWQITDMCREPKEKKPVDLVSHMFRYPPDHQHQTYIPKLLSV